MAFSRAWSVLTPGDGDNASAGAGEIRNVRDDLDDRLMTGSGSGGIIDLTGTRTINTDPVELLPGIIDTTSLEAGAVGGLTRACTYFNLVTLAKGGGDIAHTGATDILQNQWENVTGAQIIIPGTIFRTTGIEHPLGTAITSSDYVTFIVASFLARINGNDNAGLGDSSIYRLYNTTNTTVISEGDNGATTTAANHGAWTLSRRYLNTTTNSAQHMIVIGRDTARTAAATYDLQFAAVSSTGAVPGSANSIPQVRISIAALNLFALTFKR